MKIIDIIRLIKQGHSAEAAGVLEEVPLDRIEAYEVFDKHYDEHGAISLLAFPTIYHNRQHRAHFAMWLSTKEGVKLYLVGPMRNGRRIRGRPRNVWSSDAETARRYSNLILSK